MTDSEKLECEIMEKVQQLAALRKTEKDVFVSDYTFKTLSGEVRLSDLFAGRERLLVIHNMGQGCRYCTLWGDGINGIIDHLEDAMAVVMVSKDPPDTQRRMALDRGWEFRFVSHGGGAYMREQCAMGEHSTECLHCVLVRPLFADIQNIFTGRVTSGGRALSPPPFEP